MFDLFNKVPHLSSSLCSWSGEELSDCDIGPKKKKKAQSEVKNNVRKYSRRSLVLRGEEHHRTWKETGRHCYCYVREGRRTEGGGELMLVRTEGGRTCRRGLLGL